MNTNAKLTIKRRSSGKADRNNAGLAGAGSVSTLLLNVLARLWPVSSDLTVSNGKEEEVVTDQAMTKTVHRDIRTGDLVIDENTGLEYKVLDVLHYSSHSELQLKGDM